MAKIIREGKKFYLFTYTPTTDKKFLGRIMTLRALGKEVDVFITHFKKPDIHFYIKGKGYPINNELLKLLRIANIRYVMIPEDGKNGFKCYISNLSDYFDDSNLIAEDKAEPQRCIPTKNMEILDSINRDALKKGVYF